MCMCGFEQVIVLVQIDVKIQYKAGSKLSCPLLKNCCRWKMSFKIIERNVG